MTTRRPSGSTSVAVPSRKPSGSSMRTRRPSVPSGAAVALVGVGGQRVVGARASAASTSAGVTAGVGRGQAGRALRRPADVEAHADDDRAGGVALGEDPGQLRASPTSRSFGHFSVTSTPATSRQASTAASATRRVSSLGCAGTSWNRIDTSRLAPGGASHRRSRRPRPAVWWAATSTLRSGRSAAVARRSAFVLPVSATCSTVQPAVGDAPVGRVRWGRRRPRHLHWQPC